jgi:ABC-type branched-subunit amino acid transport system ATPase component
MSGLSRDYGSGHGLFNLDLEVAIGEIFGFLGPNGAGSSALSTGSDTSRRSITTPGMTLSSTAST